MALSITPLDSIRDTMIGRKIRARGIVHEKKGNIVVIKEGSSSLRVSLASVNYGGQKVTPALGDTLDATGIVKKSNAGIRIVPWQVSQVIIEKPKPKESMKDIVAVVPTHPTQPRKIPIQTFFVGAVSILISVGIMWGNPFKNMRNYIDSLPNKYKQKNTDQ